MSICFLSEMFNEILTSPVSYSGCLNSTNIRIICIERKYKIISIATCNSRYIKGRIENIILLLLQKCWRTALIGTQVHSHPKLGLSIYENAEPITPINEIERIKRKQDSSELTIIQGCGIYTRESSPLSSHMNWAELRSKR